MDVNCGVKRLSISVRLRMYLRHWERSLGVIFLARFLYQLDSLRVQQLAVLLNRRSTGVRRRPILVLRTRTIR